MKKVILLLFLSICLNIYSQSRVNPKKNLTIGEFNSWVRGVEVLGWDFNDVWKSREGYLRVGDDVSLIDIYEKYGSDIRDSKSRTEQNFNEIGVMKILFNDKQYIGIGVEKIEGRYEYPTIREDWYHFISYYIFVFEIDELLKLSDIQGNLELEPILGSYGDPIKKDQKFQSCYGNVKYSLENGSYQKWKMVVKKTNDGKNEVFRFLLPQKVRSSGTTNFIDFEKHYFEVSLEKFNDLLSKLII